MFIWPVGPVVSRALTAAPVVMSSLLVMLPPRIRLPTRLPTELDMLSISTALAGTSSRLVMATPEVTVDREIKKSLSFVRTFSLLNIPLPGRVLTLLRAKMDPLAYMLLVPLALRPLPSPKPLP